MTISLSWQRLVAIVAAMLIIPLELSLAFGITFSFREHEPLISWVFVWFAFLLDVPALPLGIVLPRWGARWVLLNAIVSGLLAMGFEVHSAMQATGANVTGGLVKLLMMFVVFWGLKLAYSWICSRQTNGDAAASATA